MVQERKVREAAAVLSAEQKTEDCDVACRSDVAVPALAAVRAVVPDVASTTLPKEQAELAEPAMPYLGLLEEAGTVERPPPRHRRETETNIYPEAATHSNAKVLTHTSYNHVHTM